MKNIIFIITITLFGLSKSGMSQDTPGLVHGSYPLLGNSVHVIHHSPKDVVYVGSFINETFDKCKYTVKNGKRSREKILPYVKVTWHEDYDYIIIETINNTSYYKVKSFSDKSKTLTVYFDNQEGGYGELTYDDYYGPDWAIFSDGLGNVIKLDKGK